MLAALGILFTLDNLEIVRARDFLRYWPVVLLLVGISQILQARSSAGMVGGSIWILIGGVLLGERLDLISNVVSLLAAVARRRRRLCRLAIVQSARSARQAIGPTASRRLPCSAASIGG